MVNHGVSDFFLCSFGEHWALLNGALKDFFSAERVYLGRFFAVGEADPPGVFPPSNISKHLMVSHSY